MTTHNSEVCVLWSHISAGGALCEKSNRSTANICVCVYHFMLSKWMLGAAKKI